MNPFEQQRPIPGVKKIIAVGSGKGGVGKSTVSSNLAVSLAEKGFKVGLLDSDLYGPSLPSLFGCIDQRPDMNEKTGKLTPLLRYGVKLMSMGLLVDEDQPVIWRGPMLFKAMDQFLHDVEWGELDFLIVDLPPGTGDVVLTLAQKCPVDYSVVVSTPQTLALSEVKKAVMMFKQLGVPVRALVENMSYMTLPNGETTRLFPKGKIENLKEDYGIPHLIELPFDQRVGMSAEAGIPFSKTQQEKSPTQLGLDELASVFI